MRKVPNMDSTRFSSIRFLVEHYRKTGEPLNLTDDAIADLCDYADWLRGNIERRVNADRKSAR